MKIMIKKIWAELIGTFFIIFFGISSIIVENVRRNTIEQLGIALSFSITFIIVATLFYRISGAHFNPAITFSSFITGKLKIKEFIVYISSQFAGGLLAGFILLILFVRNANLGGVNIEEGIIASRFEIGPIAFIILIEFIAAFLLMLTYAFCFSRLQSSNLLLPILAGSIYFIFIVIFHKLEGAGLNPVRILIPAIYVGKWKMVLYYLIGSFVGALAGGISGRYLFGEREE